MFTPVQVSLDMIHLEWGRKIKGILREVDRVKDQLSGNTLMEADLLEDETWKRMSEENWFLNLLEHLRSLGRELRKEEFTRVRQAMELTRVLILEIRWEQRRGSGRLWIELQTGIRKDEQDSSIGGGTGNNTVSRVR
jgi:hypothetical protein